jgi:hypothetical protein
MAIIQISKIQHRTGANVDLPQLAEGELGFATDERRLYIGNDPNLFPPSNTSVTTQTEILTEVSVLNWSKIGGTANTQISLNGPVGNGQVLVSNANTWVNAGGTSNIKIDLGNANNVIMRGGLNGYVLTTDGAGNLTWEGTGVGTFRIQDISKTNPAVVTTINDNTVVTGIPLTIIGVSGMTQIATAGENSTNKYYGVKLTNKTFSLYSDPALANAVNSTGFTPAVANTGNIICSFYQAGTGVPGGANTQIQFQDTAGLFGGSANLTFNKDTNNLALNGNANITRITTTLVTSANLVGSIGLGAGNANPGNFTTVAANSTISATGNITGGNLRTTGQISAGGVITAAGLNTLGNANIGNLSLTGIVKGNLIPEVDLEQNLGAPDKRWKELYLSGNTIYLGNTSITSDANGISSNVLTAENANLGNLINANFISATFTADSSSQPNITTVGTLTGLDVAGITNLGDVSNVRITGGYPDYTLITDGLGNLAWGPIVLPDIVAGNTNQIQYNVNDGLAASPNLTFTPATSTLQTVTISATGNINSANLNISNNIISSSNIRGANISSTGTVLANGNIQGANLFANTLISTAGNVNANVIFSNTANFTGNGNITGQNLRTAGVVSANGNITGANLLTSGNVSTSGAVNAVQVNAGNISVSGNIVSNNLIVNNEISSTGNITSDNYILGNGAFLTGINLGNQSGLNQIVNGTSNVSIPSVNGDVRIGSGGVANVVRVTNTGLSVTGNITANGTLSVGALSSGALTANGNISGTNLSGTGNLSITGNANVGPLGVGGALSVGGIVTAASGSVVGQLSVGGNIIGQNANLGNLARANFFQGDGSLLTNLTIGAGTQLLNGTSNVTVAANGNVSVGAGGVANVQVVSSQGVAVIGTLSANGNVTGGNLITTGVVSASGNLFANNVNAAGFLSASGNILGLNINAAGNISATGSISTTANITAAGNFAANNATLGNANVTGVISTVGVVANGNVTAANLNATGNLSVASNVNANNISITGNVLAAGNITIQNVSATSVTATGNVSASNATLGNAVTANFFLGNVRGNLFNGTTSIIVPAANANVAISVNNTTNVVVVTQNTLAITGNLSATGNANVNIVNANTANVTTVNAGAVNSSTISASGTVQAANLSTAGNLTVGANSNLANTTITGQLSVTANIIGGNLLTAGSVSTSANVDANIINSNTENVTGNATVGNLISNGVVTATGLVRGANISAVANITAGNVVSANNITTSNNLTVGNLANVANLISTTNISAYGNVKSNIVNANTLVINANATLNNLSVSSFVQSNLIPNVDDAYYLGIPSNSWHSLAVSDSGISIGQTSLTANVTELTITATNTIIPSASLTDLNVANYANLGFVSNLRILGGNAGDVLSTDGNGIVSYANVLTIVPAAGGNTEIQFNDNGDFNASPSLRFYKSNGVTSGTFAGNASRLFGITGANITGQVPNAVVATTVTFPSQANITAVGNLSSLSVVGNLRAGNANLGNLAVANFLTGVLTSSNQPNITNIGNLNNLTVSNIAGVVNFEYTSNVTLGQISNLHIAGGLSNQYITTDGSGNLYWSSPVATSVINGLSGMNVEQNGNIVFTVAGFGNRFRIEQSTFSSNVQGLFNEAVSFYSTVSLGTVANIRILGGQTGQVLTTTGVAGQIGWASAPATQSIVNGNSNIVVGPNTNIRVSVAGTPNVVYFTQFGIETGVLRTTDIINTNLARLGNVANVKIYGGNANGILTTDGTGNLFFASAPIAPTIANGLSNVTVDLSGDVRTSVAGTPNVFIVANTGITVNGRSNLGSNANVIITGGGANQLLSTDGTGNLSWVSSPPTSQISNGTSNLTISQNGNIVAVATGTTALNISNLGINVNGAINATGNINTDINRLKITGGVANRILIAADANGNLAWGTLPAANQIAGGNSNVSVNPNANVTIGVTGVPNVVVVSSNRVNITGDLSVIGNANLANIDSLNIPGGNAGDVLSTDGTGNLSFVTPSVGTSIVNGSSNVRIPASASNITFAVSGTPNVFVLSPQLANLTGNLSVTGNANINGNVNLGSALSAAGNVIGSNLITAGAVTATGNISTSLNLSVTGSATVTGQLNTGVVTLGNLMSGSGNISITGNITGNRILGNTLSTTGDITGNNLVAGANANVGNLFATNTVSAAGNIAAATNITAAGSISAIGNITADRFIGNGALLTNVTANVARIANGVSNINIPVANGNITVTVGGASVATISPGNFSITPDTGIGGNLSVFENITAGNRITANGTITAVGNITGNYLFGNGAFLTGVNTDIYNDANVANYLPNYTGNISSVNNITASGIVNTSGLRVSYLSTSSNTTLTANRAGALVDVVNSSYQIILPTPVGNQGVNFTFRLRQSGQFVTLITPSGTFEGSGYTGTGTVIISYAIGQFFYVYSDGSKYIISARIESETGAGLRVRTGVQSTSTTTGALVVTGGAGFSGNIYSGGNAVISGALQIGGSFVATGANITQVTGNVFGRTTSNIVITNGDTGNGEIAIRAGGAIIQTINNANVTVNGNITATGNISASGNFAAPFANVTGNVTTPTIIVNTITSNATNNANSTTNIFANSVTAGLLSANGSVVVNNLIGIHANGNITNVQNLQVSNVNAQNITAPVFNTGNISVSGNVVANGVVHSNNVGTGNNFRVGNSVWLGDRNTSDSLAVRGQQNDTVGYVTFGSDSTAKLGRSGTGPLTWNSNLSVSGTITANNFVGNINVANTDLSANSFTSNTFTGGNFNGRLITTVTGANTVEMIRANIAGPTNADYFSVDVGGTNQDFGYVSFNTGDNGSEPIYFRQYNGSNIQRQVTLLDQSGNTTFPGNISTTGNVAASNLIGNLTAFIGAPQTANIINAVMAGSDAFRLQIGGNLSDQGYVALDVGDENTESIIFRQFAGANFATEIRRVTLLNSQGNATFPQTVSATGFLGTSLSVSGSITGATISGTISTTGNINAGNFVGNLSATLANATVFNGASINLTSSANVAQGSVIANVYAGNTVSVTGTISGSSLIGNLTASASNVTSRTGGNISVTGNITANNVSTVSDGTGNNYAVGNDAFIGDANVADTILIKGQSNPGNGFIIFGTANNSQTLGRSGTGPLTYTGNISATGTITANNFVGNFNIAGSDLTANSFTGNNYYGGNFFGKLTTNTITGSNTAEIIRSNIADNDYFRVIVGGTGTDQGYVSFETGDGGNEPIYFRQYNGATIQNEVTLLDSTGNSIFENITANNFVGNLRVTTPTVFTNTSIVSGTMASTDGFRLVIGGSATNQGFVNIDTTDGSSNSPTPITFRQFSGLAYNSLVRTLTLLDNNGNSVFPGNITASGNVSALGNLSVSGNITVPQLNAGGNISTSGNISAAQTISAIGNINTSSTLNATTVSATGSIISSTTIRGATLSATGEVSVNGNISAVGNLTANRVSVTLVTATGNISAGVNLSATGNVQGGTLIGNVSASAASITSLTGTSASLTGNITGGILISTATGTGQNFRIGSRAWIGEVNVNDTLIVTGQQNAANGYIIFGNGNNSQSLGRAGTGPLTYSGDMSLSGNVTANNFAGNINIGNADISANSFTSNNFYGGNFNGLLTSNTLIGSANGNLILANMATNDYFRLTIGGTGVNQGFASFDVGDDGTEPIYFRQYNGANIQNQVTLLDAVGNTILPNSLSVTSNITLGGSISLGGNISTSGNITANVINGNLQVSVSGTTSANVISAAMASGDNFRLQVGGTGTDQGFASLDIADNGNEPVYVRQYVNVAGNAFGSILRQATLLGSSGETIFPGDLSVGGNLSAAGNIVTTSNFTVANLSATGNVLASQRISATGNITTASNISAVGSIIGGSFSTAGIISATANITAGNLTTAGQVSATGNITGANVIAGNLSATGNVNAPTHIGTTVSVSGNITGANLFGNLSATSAVITNSTGTTVSVTGSVTGGTVVSSATGTGQNFRVGTTTWLGDIGVVDTLMLSSQGNAANGYIVFGNGNNSAKLGRAGTGPLTYSGDMSLSGNLTAGNVLANFSLTGDVNANSFTSNNFFGGNLNGTLTCNTLTGTQTANLILANIATSDYFRVTVGGTAADNGFVSFDVGDNGNESIFFRQYTGASTVTREITLLDAAGNTSLPGNLSVVGNITTANSITANNFNGNLNISVAGSTTANIINTTIAGSDYFRLQVGGTGPELGFVSLDTANDGNEPIYVRQYISTQPNPYNAINRQLTLLDSNGQTILPGNLSVAGTTTVVNLTASGSLTGAFISPTLTGTANANVLLGTIATDDYYRIQVGGTSANAGFLSIDTADNGNEPIYVRQYTTGGSGPFTTVTRELALLDNTGNTSLPGNLIINGSNSTQFVSALGSAYRIGYRGYPVQSLSTSYTVTVNDPGLTLLFSGQSGGTLLNIPTNLSAAIAIGAEMRIINNDASQSITVQPAIGTTLRYQGGTGARILSTFADVTLIKVATDTWYINGYGIT